MCMGNLTQDFPITEAPNEMIVYQSSRLHVRIHDRWADETEPPPLQILAERLGFGRSCRDLCGSSPVIELRPAVDEPPAIGIKIAEFFANLEYPAGVGHSGFDLHPVADDSWIDEQLLNSFPGIPRDFVGIEPVECSSVAISFLENERPVQSCLCSREHEDFEVSVVAMNRDAPLVIVIFNQERIIHVDPRASFFVTRRVAHEQISRQLRKGNIGEIYRRCGPHLNSTAGRPNVRMMPLYFFPVAASSITFATSVG